MRITKLNEHNQEYIICSLLSFSLWLFSRKRGNLIFFCKNRLFSHITFCNYHDKYHRITFRNMHTSSVLHSVIITANTIVLPFVIYILLSVLHPVIITINTIVLLFVICILHPYYIL